MNLEVDFMKFTKEVLKGVNRRGQKYFPLAAHMEGNLKLLRKTGHVDNQVKSQ